MTKMQTNISIESTTKNIESLKGRLPLNEKQHNSDLGKRLIRKIVKIFQDILFFLDKFFKSVQRRLLNWKTTRKNRFKKTCSGSVELDLFYLPFGLGKAVFKKNHKQLDQVIHRIEEDPYLNQIAARYLYRLHTKENALEKSLAESENPLQEVQKTTKRYLKDSLSKALNSGMCYGRVFSILMDINSETNISAETILQSSKKVERIFYQIVFQTLHKDPKYPGKKILDPTLFDYDIQEEPLFEDVNIPKNLETIKTLLEKALDTDHTFFIVHYGSKNKGGHVACTCKNATNQYFYYDSIDDFDGGIFQANNKQAFICGLSRKILSFRQGFLSPRFEEFMICRAYNPKKNFNFNL